MKMFKEYVLNDDEIAHLRAEWCDTPEIRSETHLIKIAERMCWREMGVDPQKRKDIFHALLALGRRVVGYNLPPPPPSLATMGKGAKAKVRVADAQARDQKMEQMLRMGLMAVLGREPTNAELAKAQANIQVPPDQPQSAAAAADQGGGKVAVEKVAAVEGKPSSSSPGSFAVFGTAGVTDEGGASAAAAGPKEPLDMGVVRLAVDELEDKIRAAKRSP